jgi:hypothetical protein
MSSKCFIWIVHVLIYLWEFSRNFCDFRSIFRAFKQFLVFSGICFRIKNNFKKRKKTYPTGTGRARRPDPLRPPSKPIGARPQVAKLLRAAATSRLGRRARLAPRL